MNRPMAAAFAALLALTAPLAAQEFGMSDGTSPETLTTGTEPAAPARNTPILLNQIDPSKNLILRYDVRLGVQGRPAYFGSDEYVAAPDFALHIDYAKLRGVGEYGSIEGNERPSVLGLRGSLRFIGARNSDDYPELKGFEDIPMAVELGMGVVYRQRNFQAWGDVRYGFIGHQDFTGEIGADVIGFPTERWEFRGGPRFTFGDQEFADIYFGVTASEAASSGLDEFNPDGGLLGAGVEAVARYRFNDLWGIEAAVRADRLLNDAASSPITEMGSADQYRVRVGVTRELILQF